MKIMAVAVVLCLTVFYLMANAAFALLNPGEWVRAWWTARRGIDQRYDSWTDMQIRALGVFYILMALAISGFAIKLVLERIE